MALEFTDLVSTCQFCGMYSEITLIFVGLLSSTEQSPLTIGHSENVNIAAACSDIQGQNQHYIKTQRLSTFLSSSSKQWTLTATFNTRA